MQKNVFIRNIVTLKVLSEKRYYSRYKVISFFFSQQLQYNKNKTTFWLSFHIITVTYLMQNSEKSPSIRLEIQTLYKICFTLISSQIIYYNTRE